MAKTAIGFGRDQREGEDEEAIKKLFTPEFRNRLDAVVPFDYLPTEVVSRVVEKFILELEIQLAERNVMISVTEDAKKWMAEKGYDKSFGARPLGRVIQENIKKPLADELLFGRLQKGGEVVIRMIDGKIDFEITPNAAPSGNRKKRKPRPAPVE
jgi:ATP-dependent Clp protease ATP-binding subunit ClpA